MIVHYSCMLTSKVTKRGQTTIPRQVRDALHIEAGQSLIYEIRRDAIMLRAHPGALASFAALGGRGRVGSADFVQARKEAREAWTGHAAGEGLDP